jgi:RHS repeat-associated protein
LTFPVNINAKMLRLLSQLLAAILSLALGIPIFANVPVGDRKQLTSTLAPVPAGLWNYDANDRFTAGDTYDADGNTVSSGGIANVYDFENHLIQKGGATIIYDGDGNRVSKTVAGVTTTYLVDTLNPTGYAQVLGESFAGASGAQELSHNYVYGLELISQARHYFTGTQSLTQTIYYVYDGHGSVRALTGPTGAVTDTYDYDAFGNLIHSTGTTLNNYLFAGEQFDPDLNLYFNRARYLNTSTGRFWNMDSFEGDRQSPSTLHKYLYAGNDPINKLDPSGHDVIEALGALAVAAVVLSIAGDNAPQILKNVRQDDLRKDFQTQFTQATIQHAQEVGAYSNGTISNIVDTPCIIKSLLGSPAECEHGCLAWQNWMLNIWFPQAQARNIPNWQGIALRPVYSIDFPIPFAHNYVRATFPLTPLILDPWRDFRNPVWDEKDYMRVVCLTPTPGSFFLFQF